MAENHYFCKISGPTELRGRSNRENNERIYGYTRKHHQDHFRLEGRQGPQGDRTLSPKNQSRLPLDRGAVERRAARAQRGAEKAIADFIAEDEARIVELKARLELAETTLDEKERISKEIDQTTKRIDERIEEKLDEILPEAFAIMKDTARRFAQSDEVVVTANDFDRDLAATKDFVRIEGDKAVYATHWTAGATTCGGT